jgi:hypothetical protein
MLLDNDAQESECVSWSELSDNELRLAFSILFEQIAQPNRFRA